MNYAKLEAGRLVALPLRLHAEGRTIFNPNPELLPEGIRERLRNEGYKKVVRDEMEEPEDPSKAYREEYAEEDGCIRVKRVEDVAEPAPEQPYEVRAEALIRARYTVSDELAVLRQRDTKPGEFEEYFTFCEACKAAAKETSV